MKKFCVTVAVVLVAGALAGCGTSSEASQEPSSAAPPTSAATEAPTPTTTPEPVVEEMASVAPPTCWDIPVPQSVTFIDAYTPEEAKASLEASAGEGAGSVDVFPCSLVADGSQKDAADAWIAALVAEGWQEQYQSGDDNYWQGGATAPDGSSVIYNIAKPDRGFTASSSFSLFAPM